MNARYPNLELLEYKATVALSSDEEFLKILEEQRKNNKYAYVEMDAALGNSGMSEKEKAEFKEGIIQAIHRQEEAIDHGHKKRS